MQEFLYGLILFSLIAAAVAALSFRDYLALRRSRQRSRMKLNEALKRADADLARAAALKEADKE